VKNSEEDNENALSIPTRFFQKWTEINGGLQMILQTKLKFRLSKKHHPGAEREGIQDAWKVFRTN